MFLKREGINYQHQEKRGHITTASTDIKGWGSTTNSCMHIIEKTDKMNSFLKDRNYQAHTGKII